MNFYTDTMQTYRAQAPVNMLLALIFVQRLNDLTNTHFAIEKVRYIEIFVQSEFDKLCTHCIAFHNSNVQ